MTKLLAIGCLTILSLSVHAEVPADTAYTIPIYVQSLNAPSKYLIYASQDGGAAVPYLFDTGSPNMFTVQGADTSITPTGSFTFGDGDPVYGYYQSQNTISLTDQTGQVIVSTANQVGIAKVVSINGSTVSGNALADGTYGDFGAGMYGTSTLGTILTALPLGSAVRTGWMVNVAGLSSGTGSLTVGLTADTIANIKSMPGAIVMKMNSSGVQLTTATGMVDGYQKTAVTATLSVQQDGLPTITTDIGTVFDTGGGPNAVIYDTEYSTSYTDGTLTLSYEGQIFTYVSGETIWGGKVVAMPNEFGGERVNPGGFLYQNNIVMFDLDNAELTLVPYAVPEPAALALVGLGLLLFLGRRKQAKTATPSRA